MLCLSLPLCSRGRVFRDPRAARVRAPRFHAKVLAETWSFRFRDLFESAAGALMLSAEQWAIVESDGLQCKASVTLALQTKLQFLSGLPWLLAGLAVVDEERARTIGRRALAQFEAAPAEALHHRVTWTLLQPGAAFREDLERFVDGTPRASLSSAFRGQVAEFRLWQFNETGMEAKHGRVALDSASHHVGSTRVSLSVRQLVLQRRLCRDPAYMEQLTREFERVRHVRQAAVAMGFDMHPKVLALGRRPHTHQLAPTLAGILHRCDEEGQFQALAAERRTNSKAAEAAKRAAELALAGAAGQPVAPLAEEAVWEAAALSHFRQLAEPGALHSFRQGPASRSEPLRAYADLTEASAVKRRRVMSDASGSASPAMEADGDEAALLTGVPPAPLAAPAAEVPDSPGECGETLFFKVVHMMPGGLKTVPVAPGAGRKLQRTQVAATLHRARGDGLVDIRPVGEECDVAPLTLLSGFARTAASQADAVLKWKTGPKLAWQLQSHSGPNDPRLVSELVTAGAYPEADETDWFTPRAPGDVDSLRAWQDAGLVASCGRGRRWHLTASGVANLRACWQVASPEPCFRPRAGVPLQEQTSFELLCHLRSEGWAWRPLPARRPFPEGYKVGGLKEWLSRLTPYREYLVALLRADELQGRGLRNVPHGMPQRVYVKILKYDFSDLDGAELLPRPMEPDGPLGHGAEGLRHATPEAIMPPSPGSSDDDGRGHSERQVSSHESEDSWASGLHEALASGVQSQDSAAPATPKVNAAPATRQPVAEDLLDVAASAGHEAGVDNPAEPGPAPQAGSEPDELDEVLRSTRWGCFRLTPKRPGPNSRHGGYEAVCPFHALSNRTLCKRFVSMQGPGREQQARSLRMLLHWCSMAPDFSRQRFHVAEPLHIDLTPPYPVIKARMPLHGPVPGSVQTDAQLDRLARLERDGAPASQGPGAAGGSGSAEAAGSGQSRPAGRTRQPRNGRGRGRGRGRARGHGRSNEGHAAESEAEGPGSKPGSTSGSGSSSSSDSSSSSSSSSSE